MPKSSDDSSFVSIRQLQDPNESCRVRSTGDGIPRRVNKSPKRGLHRRTGSVSTPGTRGAISGSAGTSTSGTTGGSIGASTGATASASTGATAGATAITVTSSTTAIAIREALTHVSAIGDAFEHAIAAVRIARILLTAFAGILINIVPISTRDCIDDLTFGQSAERNGLNENYAL